MNIVECRKAYQIYHVHDYIHNYVITVNVIDIE